MGKVEVEDTDLGVMDEEGWVPGAEESIPVSPGGLRRGKAIWQVWPTGLRGTGELYGVMGRVIWVERSFWDTKRR